MFSSVFEEYQARVRETVSAAHTPSAGRTEELLAKSAEQRLDLAELAELLEIGNDPAAESQFQTLRTFVTGRFRNTGSNRLRYISPIYISSFCVDRCGYCNFSAARQTAERKRLTIEGLEEEVATVMAAGPRVIELVLATDPEYPWPVLVKYVEKTKELLKGEPGSAVLLCSDYLPLEGYKALHEAGLWGMVQWDETLEPDVYERWHSTSPRKRNFKERIDNHDRAMAAGIEVASSALLGLADYRYEVLMQIAKTQYLESEYGRPPFTAGTPRLKPIGGKELHLTTEVTDRAYETVLMVHKIANPQGGRWLQTRETFTMNTRNALHDDVFTYRCGEVRPGGYKISLPKERAEAGGQFGVNDLTQGTVEQELNALGFHIDYAWVGRS